jgi:hypothetical protein
VQELAMSPASPCSSWVHVDDGVDVALDCARNGRWLKMRLSSAVKLAPVPTETNSSHFSVGLLTAANTWSYRRAFSRCLGARVSRNNPKYRSTAVRASFVSARTYQLDISLPTCSTGSGKIKMYVYGGIEHCSTALESLPAAEFHDNEGTRYQALYGNFGCDYNQKGKAKVISSFVVPPVLANYPSPASSAAPSTASRSCSFDHLPGWWSDDGREWMLQGTRATRSTSGSGVGSAISGGYCNHPEINTEPVVPDSAAPPVLPWGARHVCFLGDSHFE